MFLEWENNSGKLQIISGKFLNSGKFQNNAINDVKQISLSHVIKAKIYFVFLKNVLKQTWKSSTCKFWPYWKDRKRSYQVRKILARFCNIIAL